MRQIRHEQLAPWEPINEQVRYRFQASRTELIRLGFKELCCYRETTGPFGLLLYLPIIFAEIVKVHGLLRVSLHLILLTAQDYATYALVFGMGVKFYTPFVDGTALITANFRTTEVQDAAQKFYKAGCPGSMTEAWGFHRAAVEHHRAAGSATSATLNFGGFVELSTREDMYRAVQDARGKR